MRRSPHAGGMIVSRVTKPNDRLKINDGQDDRPMLAGRSSQAVKERVCKRSSQMGRTIVSWGAERSSRGRTIVSGGQGDRPMLAGRSSQAVKERL